MTDPDERQCPGCGETFIVIDAKDWRRYTTHLEGHIEEQTRVYT